ncbi:MAG: hypothetical protein ACKV0T_04345 [Planctomycetales bacterium]
MTDRNDGPERRPITSRDHPLSIRVARAIAQSGICPNAISLAGMIAGVLAGLALANTNRPKYGWILFIAAAALMQLRLLLSNMDWMYGSSSVRDKKFVAGGAGNSLKLDVSAIGDSIMSTWQDRDERPLDGLIIARVLDWWTEEPLQGVPVRVAYTWDGCRGVG